MEHLFRFAMNLSTVVFCTTPNTFREVTINDNLETSIIQNARFVVIISEIFLDFQECQDAPFLS